MGMEESQSTHSDNLVSRRDALRLGQHAAEPQRRPPTEPK